MAYPEASPVPAPAPDPKLDPKPAVKIDRAKEALVRAPKDVNAPAVQHTVAEEEYLAQLYAELDPEARLAYVTYFLARTPAHLQEDMKDLVEASLPEPAPPPPETQSVAPRSDPPVGHTANP